MRSWWSLGDGIGYRGSELNLRSITCAFCNETGNFTVAFEAIKKRQTDGKTLHFDTLKCGNCAAYVMVLWSGASLGGAIHDFRVLPWSLQNVKAPVEWPQDVGRYWAQAHSALTSGNWDAAALMARSALQIAMREQSAAGGSLKKEIDDLTAKGLLPAVVSAWSHEVRELGNDAAHPAPGQAPTQSADAEDIVEFLDYLLRYLYTLPHQIAQYRQRRTARANEQPKPHS